MASKHHPSEKSILDALRTVQDPDLHKDIVTLNFVKNLKIEDGKVSFTMELTTPACPVKKKMEQWAREAVLGKRCAGGRYPDDFRRFAGSGAEGKQAIEGVKNIIAVGSGKGGVGKDHGYGQSGRGSGAGRRYRRLDGCGYLWAKCSA